MIQIGNFNELTVTQDIPIGLYLGDGEEEILLPRRYVPQNIKVGDKVEAFVYLDNENRPVATTRRPKAVVGDFVFLKIKDINEHGAFFDWGIDKDVFAPYSEQTGDLQPGKKYLVYIFIDERSGRIAASLRWEQFLEDPPAGLTPGTSVRLLIAKKTEIGYKAVVDNRYEGLLYSNEIFQPLQEGNIIQGYIKQIREDGKIDLSLQQAGYELIDSAKEILLRILKERKGKIPLGDKSPPEDIYSLLKMSKKAFKKAIGRLYKDRLVSVGDFETTLLSNPGTGN